MRDAFLLYTVTIMQRAIAKNDRLFALQILNRLYKRGPDSLRANGNNSKQNQLVLF